MVLIFQKALKLPLMQLFVGSILRNHILGSPRGHLSLSVFLFSFSEGSSEQQFHLFSRIKEGALLPPSHGILKQS